MFTDTEKKQLYIFTAVAYGLPFLFGFYMWYGAGKDLDLSVFPNAQMFYPAAGAILALLVTRKGDGLLPRRFFTGYLVITLVMVLICFASMAVPQPAWATLVQFPIIVGSVAAWILLLTDKKDKRAAYGLRFKNVKASVLCVLLFLLLYTGRSVVSFALAGQFSQVGVIFSSPQSWIVLVALIPNFFLIFLAFFGEEYGWRYFLQPLLQKRFGLRKGVLLLGVVWGLWHLPIDFFYYAKGYGLQAALGQQITCITLGIFFAYAYMKTDNIWVPVILHMLNNNLVPVFSQNFAADVLEDQVVTWASLLPSLLLNGLVFGLFLLSKVFNEKRGPSSEEAVTGTDAASEQ